MSIAALTLPDASRVGSLSDDELLALQADIAASRRRLDAAAAAVAGEVSRRSSRDLGYDGLAQRTGARTADKLVQTVSGVTRAESRAFVRVGEALADPAPWLSSVSAAVESGRLSIAAADGIIAGLGSASDTVAADDLADAAVRLVRAAEHSSPESIAQAARAVRDALDAGGAEQRERALRDQRFLKLIPEPGGTTRIVGRLDPESAAIVVAAVDRVTAPRRGGPRFVDASEERRSLALERDSRTTEQLALDALVDMVRLASVADDGTLFGARAPQVVVHIDVTDLASGSGTARIDGQSAAVSAVTAQRLACSTGHIPVLFDGNRPLDVGRSERLYTGRQRLALAARDAGCVFPECDRPPSWCEAHHIRHWHRDRGGTDVADGVLLCRHHHLLVHNSGWEIERHDRHYVLIPPRAVDPHRQPRPLEVGRGRRRATASRTAQRSDPGEA